MNRIFSAGTGESMQYLAHAFNDNTIRFVLYYNGRVDAQRLKEATVKLASDVDILHSIFLPRKLRARWMESEAFGAEDCFSLLQTREDPCAVAEAQAVLPIRAEDRTKLFCTLVQGPDQAAVVFRVSHLCVDGIDSKYLLGKLAQAYNLPLPEPLQVKNGNRAPEQVYENLTKEEKKALMRNPLSGMRSVFPFPEEGDGTPRASVRMIPAAVMQSARRRAKEAGATANDLLLTACYHAYAATPGVEPNAPMGVVGMMDLRRHCRNVDALGLSNLSGTLTTLLHNGVEETFAQTLKQVAAQTARAKEEPYAGLKGLPLLHMAVRGLPMALLQIAARRVYRGMGFGLTNIGNLDCSQYCLGDLRPVGGWFGGPLKKKPSVQISAASFDGACVLSVVGEYTSRDMEALQRFLDSMAAEIAAYARQ